MKQRSVAVVLLLTVVTFGLYQIYWFIKTKDEMVSLGADIPTGLLLIIPIVNLYWMWKWSEGVEHVTNGRTSAVASIVLLVALGLIGPMILQAALNRVAAAEDPPLPIARVV